MKKRKNEELILGDDGELPIRRSRLGEVPWGCIGTVAAALIAFLGSILVKAPDTKTGMPQPILIFIVETVLNSQASQPTIITPTIVAAAVSSSPTPDIIQTRTASALRTEIIDEITGTAQASTPTVLT